MTVGAATWAGEFGYQTDDILELKPTMIETSSCFFSLFLAVLYLPNNRQVEDSVNIVLGR